MWCTVLGRWPEQDVPFQASFQWPLLGPNSWGNGILLHHLQLFELGAFCSFFSFASKFLSCGLVLAAKIPSTNGGRLFESSVISWSSFTKFYLKISPCCSWWCGCFCCSRGGSPARADISPALEVGPGDSGVNAGGLLDAVCATVCHCDSPQYSCHKDFW